jgi:hypothetical protein
MVPSVVIDVCPTYAGEISTVATLATVFTVIRFAVPTTLLTVPPPTNEALKVPGPVDHTIEALSVGTAHTGSTPFDPMRIWPSEATGKEAIALPGAPTRTEWLLATMSDPPPPELVKAGSVLAVGGKIRDLGAVLLLWLLWSFWLP